MEIAVDSIESVIQAVNGGAFRLEVCSSLAIGGLTPSVGLLKSAKDYLKTNDKFKHVQILAMIRPREGDFFYTNNEVEQMRNDIKLIKELNLADGFVFGLLTIDGQIDGGNCKLLLEAANPCPVTCHRAFDTTCSPLEALEILIVLGFKRILTSGRKSNAFDGCDFIAELIEKAANRIEILPGAGVSEQNLPALTSKLNVKQYHGTASVASKSQMTYRNDHLNDIFSDWRVTDSRKVQTMIEIINQS